MAVSSASGGSATLGAAAARNGKAIEGENDPQRDASEGGRLVAQHGERRKQFNSETSQSSGFRVTFGVLNENGRTKVTTG